MSSAPVPSSSRSSNARGGQRRAVVPAVLASVALVVAVLALILVLLLRMCSSPSTSTQPADCTPGLSAYELWLSTGNSGSIEDFMQSLIGEKGADGYVGSDGFTGADGKSAYQHWLDAGNSGSEQFFLDSLVGATGLTGTAGMAGLTAYQLWLQEGHSGDEEAFLNWLIGPQGTSGPSGSPGASGAPGPAGSTGPSGSPGATGQSAYQLWESQPENTGKSEAQFLIELKGAQGPEGVCTVGDTGATGPAGPAGPSGSPGPAGSPGPQGLTGSTGPEGPMGPQGIPGTSGISSTYRGSFLSYETQQTSNPNTPTKMYFEIPDITNQGVTMNGNPSCATAACTEITFANAGTYNIQFSAQLYNSSGGGSGNTASIWLGKANSPVAWSATNVSVNSNNPYRVAAWNFFVTAAAGDTFELYWSADSTSVTILGAPDNGIRPGIPSIILTVNQVG